VKAKYEYEYSFENEYLIIFVLKCQCGLGLDNIKFAYTVTGWILYKSFCFSTYSVSPPWLVLILL